MGLCSNTLASTANEDPILDDGLPRTSHCAMASGVWPPLGVLLDLLAPKGSAMILDRLGSCKDHLRGPVFASLVQDLLRMPLHCSHLKRLVHAPGLHPA